MVFVQLSVCLSLRWMERAIDRWMTQSGVAKHNFSIFLFPGKDWGEKETSFYNVKKEILPQYDVWSEWHSSLTWVLNVDEMVKRAQYVEDIF